MNMSPLYAEIVKIRQEKAGAFAAILEKAKPLYHTLVQVMESALVSPKPEKSAAIKEKLQVFIETLENKYERFSNGLVTVAVAGLEKSGKTTFLKEYTGIQELPTASQRCTSVACEIICAAEGEKERAVIQYYTREQLLESINARLRDMQQPGDALWCDGRQRAWEPNPTSIEEFKHYNLPSIEDIHGLFRETFCNGSEGGSGTLPQLKSIQEALRSHASCLGTESIIPIEELSRYASHRTHGNESVSELQPLIYNITIYKRYSDSMQALRLCDTPGVDDPNPQAQRRALHTIKMDTDMLIIASRPCSKPSVTGLDSLLRNLRTLDKEVPWRERSIFLINWDKQADPDGMHADLHKQEVICNGTFPDSCVYGPCDIKGDVDARNAFMETVYERLLNRIPAQDNDLVKRLEEQWKDIVAEVRVNILDVLRRQAPPEDEGIREQLSISFDKWFDGTNKSSHPSSYFMGRLTTMFGEKTERFSDLQELAHIRSTVESVLKEESEKLNEWLIEEASPERCDAELKRTRNAVDEIMPKLSTRVTAIVHRLVNVVTEISPIVQNEVLSVLRYALGDKVADAFCGKYSGNSVDAGQQLAALHAKMKEAADAVRQEEVYFIANQLKEFSNLSLQMAYVLRHELRPCLNLLNPHHWLASRKQKLVEKSIAILSTSEVADASMNIDWLKQYLTQSTPSLGGDDKDAHSRFLFNLAECVYSILETLVVSNDSQLTDLLEDYIEQASQTLSSQSKCEAGWKWGLSHHKRVVLRNEWEEYEKASANSQEYQKLLKQLQEVM